MYVCHVHLYFMAPTFWYWRYQCMHITLTALELCLLYNEFRYCSLANKCHWWSHFFTVHYTCSTLLVMQNRLSAHSWALCIQKRAQNYSVIRWLMTSVVFTMLADLWFKLQVVSHADKSDFSQLHTVFCQFHESHYINQTEINKPLSTEFKKKTVSKSSILLFNSEYIRIFCCICRIWYHVFYEQRAGFSPSINIHPHTYSKRFLGNLKNVKFSLLLLPSQSSRWQY